MCTQYTLLSDNDNENTLLIWYMWFTNYIFMSPYNREILHVLFVLFKVLQYICLYVHLRYYNILSCMCRGEMLGCCAYLWQDYIYKRICIYVFFLAWLRQTSLKGIFIGFIYFPPHPTNRIKFVFITFLESREAFLVRDFFFFFEEHSYVRLRMKNSQGVYHCHVLFVTCLNECV